MMLARRTHRENSLERRTTMLETEAPKVLRIPISFVRLSVVNEARPKIPRQEMNIAMKAK